MKKLPLAGGAVATFSRARSLPAFQAVVSSMRGDAPHLTTRSPVGASGIEDPATWNVPASLP